MAKLIFVNLPVSDLARATAFYEAVGAVKNPQFSDHTASCMVFSDTIYVMLLTHGKFRQFIILPGTAHSVVLATNRQLFWHVTRSFLTMPAPIAT